jgi:Flp pilus assembly protein TadG
MPRFSIRGFRSLMRDEDGNVFILFGAAVIPLILFLGGAVDITRYNRHKTDLANALDAAALSLGRQGMDWNEAQAKTFIIDHIAASGVYSDPKFWLVDYTVEKTDKGFYVDADATMKTIFLPLTSLDGESAPLNSMQVNVDAEVVHSSNRLELALVIDNTGSMNCGATVGSCTSNWSNPPASSRIKSVKVAAKTLVDTLMRDDLENDDLIKIALVPFEGTVNVASTGFSVTSPPNGQAAWRCARVPTNSPTPSRTRRFPTVSMFRSSGQTSPMTAPAAAATTTTAVVTIPTTI